MRSPLNHCKDAFVNQLQPGWFWVRELPAEWNIQEEGLFIRSLPGSLWENSNNARNVLLRPLADASSHAWQTEVDVIFRPEASGEQAGLVWYHDDDHYIKLVKELVGTEHVIVLAYETEGRPKVTGKIAVTGDAVRMRLTKDGGKVIGMFQEADSGAWIHVGDCEPLAATTLQVGCLAHGGVDEGNWAIFSDFAVE